MIFCYPLPHPTRLKHKFFHQVLPPIVGCECRGGLILIAVVFLGGRGLHRQEVNREGTYTYLALSRVLDAFVHKLDPLAFRSTIPHAEKRANGTCTHDERNAVKWATAK